MKTLENSSDRLVLEVRPFGLMLLCIFLFLLFLVLGLGMGSLLPSILKVLGFPSNMPGVDMAARSIHIGPLAYASVIPLLVAVFLIKTRRVTLDRVAGTVSLASRGLFGRSTRDYPLASFQGAMLAQSRSHDSYSHRAVLMFSDENGHVSVTPYGTSGQGPVRMVNAINQWVGASSGSDLSQLTGDQAKAALAALQGLGIKINGLPRR